MACSSASPRRWSVCGGSPRICSSPCRSRGVRRASSIRAWSGRIEPGGAVHGAGGLLAPLGQLARHGAGGVARGARAGAGARRRARRCARRSTPPRHGTPHAPSRAGRAPPAAAPAPCPARAAGARRRRRTRAACSVSGRLSQRVKPSLPVQLDLEHLAHERLVALLVAEAQEAGRHLGVEDVRDLRLPGASQDRHVLAPGVDDDLDRRVGQHPGERARGRARARSGRAPRCVPRPGRRDRAPPPVRGRAAPGSGARRRTRCRWRAVLLRRRARLDP